ncbi:peroxisomal long chain acyl-CoA synthetase 7 [Echria macrotheca]|uniref:Peroxisomal long chain acyl-CoA synthetase 7 n=1 Tax=Echria macrotheca TaxID=438768 RepID=A0AAJ0BMA2_9PEZI|nr:peroxisomal long chain acyl-CoA synthetase 7 [Echria macrotheca]
MTFFDQLMLHLDEGVTGLFGQWNIFSSIILTLFAGLITYQVATRQEPDTHPFLLARQAQPSPVRHEGESPVYRSQAAPHGMPLNSGLNVKDPGVSKWAKGRDGDLRDIWRQAIAGVQEDGPTKGAKGRILTVLGTENITEHRLEDLTRQINLIGQHVLEQGGNRVAIYSPNSVELIVTLFACAFHNLTAIILPFDQSDEAVISMLRRSAADTVVTAPGSFPFDSVVKSYPSLRQLIWVVDEGSSHMDWNEVPQGTGGSVNVSTWQDIVSDYPVDAGKELPPLESQKEPRDVTIFWQSKPGTTEEMVRFTAANLISAVAAQIFAIPTSQRIGPSDLFLPADSLANTHTLILTLAALYSNASVAFNSVSSQANDLAIATRGIAPTILVATPASLLKTHQEASRSLQSFVARNLHQLQTRSLVQNGVMPAASLISSYYDNFRPSLGTKPGKLRLIFTADRAGAGTPRLSSRILSDLRVYTGARVIYALTAAKVAGAVTQTGFYDYRVFEDATSHFGPPLTSTEILLRDTPTVKNTDGESKGEIIVRGPAVATGEAALGVEGIIRDDNTLAYL